MVSIVIVSFNCRDLVLACLESIFATCGLPDFEVIVVDNASSDRTVEAITARFGGVRTIRSETNIGFGPACNIGAEAAATELIMLINPDTLMVQDTVGQLLSFAAEWPDAGIWGGKTIDSEGRAVVGSCWRFPTLWSTFCIVSGLAKLFPNSDLFNREAYGGWNRHSVRRVDIVSGCLFLIRKGLWNQLNGFNPIYFMYSEEADLCLRAHQAGARPMVSPDVEIVHFVGKTQGIRSERFVRLLKGRCTFMRLHWSPFRDWLGQVLLLLWPVSRFLALGVIGSMLRSSSARLSAQTWRAVWDQRHDWKQGYCSGL